MSINLNKFTERTMIVAPVINGVGQYGQRKFKMNVKDGWYRLLLGNDAVELAPATQLEAFRALLHRDVLMGYPIGRDIVPTNFDNFKQRGYTEMVRVIGLDMPPFMVARVVQWDDGRWYWLEPDLKQNRELLSKVQKAYEAGETIPDIPGITPELRYYVLLMHMQNGLLEAVENLKKYATDNETLKKQFADFQAKIGDRIRLAVELAGGEYHSYAKKGKKYIVTWGIGGQKIKSVVDDTLRIDSAGFCLEGDDKKHSLNSIINLAGLFQDDGPLYITRE